MPCENCMYAPWLVYMQNKINKYNKQEQVEIMTLEA